MVWTCKFLSSSLLAVITMVSTSCGSGSEAADAGNLPMGLECRAAADCAAGGLCVLGRDDVPNYFDDSSATTGEEGCNAASAGKCVAAQGQPLVGGCWCYFGPNQYLPAEADDGRGHIICAD